MATDMCSTVRTDIRMGMDRVDTRTVRWAYHGHGHVQHSPHGHQNGHGQGGHAHSPMGVPWPRTCAAQSARTSEWAWTGWTRAQSDGRTMATDMCSTVRTDIRMGMDRVDTRTV